MEENRVYCVGGVGVSKVSVCTRSLNQKARGKAKPPRSQLLPSRKLSAPVFVVRAWPIPPFIFLCLLFQFLLFAN